jgi:hypothetical protein
MISIISLIALRILWTLVTISKISLRLSIILFKAGDTVSRKFMMASRGMAIQR